jgi:hypothetical protein
VAVQINVPGTGETLKYSLSLWPGQDSNLVGMDRVWIFLCAVFHFSRLSTNPILLFVPSHGQVIEDSTGPTINTPLAQYQNKSYLNGKYEINVFNRQLTLKPLGKTAADPALAIFISQGQWSIAIDVPGNLGPHQSMNGVMGSNKPITDPACRFTTPSGECESDMERWTASWVVGPQNPPITFHTESEGDFDPFPRHTEPVFTIPAPPERTEEAVELCEDALKSLGLSAKEYKGKFESCLLDASNPAVVKANVRSIKRAQAQKRATTLAAYKARSIAKSKKFVEMEAEVHDQEEDEEVEERSLSD